MTKDCDAFKSELGEFHVLETVVVFRRFGIYLEFKGKIIPSLSKQCTDEIDFEVSVDGLFRFI